MAAELASAPVLSTPDDLILEARADQITSSTLSDDGLKTTYDIPNTVEQIRLGGWKRVALQFPDHMLVDAPRISEALRLALSTSDGVNAVKIHILADTSYSACCVDEVAAEHADSQVVVHYGRTCLSPTSRLPVIYVYTSHQLDHTAVVREFTKEFPDKTAAVVVMADLTYQDHIDDIVQSLNAEGYEGVISTVVARDPTATIPNRTVVGPPRTAEELKSHALFHISDPPTSLLLALQTRFASLHILSTSSSSPAVDNPTFRAAGLLRRRFARVLSLASAGVVGILVNTLSVSSYISSIELLREKIAKAGKKSYTIVVGKLNPAKLANFAEIEGWVVVGCWESGLIEDDVSYWRPLVTPFEMEVALMSEEERIWGGEWWGGIESLKPDAASNTAQDEESKTETHIELMPDNDDEQDGVEGDESLPPVFDLRTGTLVSHSRPMHLTVQSKPHSAEGQPSNEDQGQSEQKPGAVTKRYAGELASVNGVASPGAEFLRSKRTWQGLGSDFDQEASTVIEEGRSGIARGYKVGDEETSRH